MVHTPRKKIRLDLDVAPAAAGFGSARTATAAHRRVAANYASPLLFGPPNDDALLALVMHMFTVEEAELAQHLPPLRPRTAAKVARLSGRPVDEVAPILDHLVFTKAVILRQGKRRPVYTILPVVPGTFEMALITADLSTRNAWHQRFAELFEQVYDSGYLGQYVSAGRDMLRVLPTNRLSGSLQGAWPVEKLEELLEPYEHFAIGNCQCRMAMQLVGKGCGRPLENCVAFGPMAKPAIGRGMMRSASKQAVLDAKRGAEESGCVTWIGNIRKDWRGNISCSCCGCCCHALRLINEFSSPAMICPPHFTPERDDALCRAGCRLCHRTCPTGAWSKPAKGERSEFSPNRCVGCGLCVVACPHSALQLAPTTQPRLDKNWGQLIAKGLPAHLLAGARVWARRLVRR